VQITRFCTLHPERTETFYCFPEAMQALVFCTERECRCDNSVDEGVFLRHINCKMRNPFWDERAGEVVVPGEADTTRTWATLDFGSGQPKEMWVQHWLVGALRSLPKTDPEMWFPLMLLRATAEMNGKGRTGRLVELVGARESGKTVIAMQAMNYHGYVSINNTTDSVDLDNYIFSRNSGNLSFSIFLETLHLNTLLRRNAKEIFLPRATVNEPGHLKVAFIRPAQNASPLALSGQEKSNGLVRSAFSWTFNALKSLKGEMRVAAGQVLRGSRPFWYTLALYDTAGEASENEDLMPDLASVDKVAVVVNAAEIFGLLLDKSEKSIEVAVQRIARAKKRGQHCDLILTQMDRARSHLTEDWKRVEEIANDLYDDRKRESQALLAKWLSKQPDENKILLGKSLKNVKNIFFVWTENLPTKHAPEQQAVQPCSYGLARFICRSLDIKWEHINQRTED
jgi:hypothetical protein